jgi:hypothetical protein
MPDEAMEKKNLNLTMDDYNAEFEDGLDEDDLTCLRAILSVLKIAERTELKKNN